MRLTVVHRTALLVVSFLIPCRAVAQIAGPVVRVLTTTSRWPGDSVSFRSKDLRVAITTPVSELWIAQYGIPAECPGPLLPPTRLTDDQIAITILPAQASASKSCNAFSWEALAQGILPLSHVGYDPAEDPLEATVMRNDSVVAILDSVSARVTQGDSIASFHALRIVVGREAIAPMPNGELPDLALHVTTAGLSITLPVPAAVVRQTWYDLLSTRGAGGATQDLLAAGYESLPPQERLDRRVRLVVDLATLGDSSSARVLGREVVHENPCFALASSYSADVRSLFPPRAVKGCASLPPVVAGTAALLLPGLGQLLQRRNQSSLLFSALSLTAGAAAWGFKQRARDRYREWNGTGQEWFFLPILTEAHDADRQAAVYTRVLGVLWAANIVDAWWGAHRRAVHLRRLGSYEMRIRSSPLR